MTDAARTAAIILAGLSLCLGGLHSFRVRTPAGFLLWLPKVVAGSLAPYLALVGLAAAALALVYGGAQAGWIALAGLAGAALSTLHAVRSGSVRGDLAGAFGPGWPERIPATLRPRLPRRRWSWRLPSAPRPKWHRDLVFWTIPAAVERCARPLLCDLWEPAPGVPRTGLAFIYLHGGAWHFLDKDFRTRTLFRHLAGQGHVVMDVAYRLSPETDLWGMVDDARRAIAWMKEHGPEYCVDRERIVIGGGSAGAHIALLAAYQPGRDTSVAGVVSFYGPTDMRACHAHTGARVFEAWGRLLSPGPRTLAGRLLPRVLGSVPARLGNVSALTGGVAGFVRNTLGPGALSRLEPSPGAGPDPGDPWEQASPAALVRPGLPPTLIFQGDHDCLAPVAAAREFQQRLSSAGVPTVYLEYPATEHAFDLFLPRLSPAAQNALHHLDRFLALLVGAPSLPTG